MSGQINRRRTHKQQIAGAQIAERYFRDPQAMHEFVCQESNPFTEAMFGDIFDNPDFPEVRKDRERLKCINVCAPEVAS